MLKSIISEYSDEYEPPRDYKKVLGVRADTCQNVYLTLEEIERFSKYEPKSRAEWIIKNQFLIGCLTGARHSDYINFTRQNLQDDCLQYVSVKTHIKASIPISPAIIRLIDENEKNGFVGIAFADVYFRNVVKRICRSIGLDESISIYYHGKQRTGKKWEFIASHTARRSFATNLYKLGVDIYTISRLCGHTSVEMTKTYICCMPNISETALTYFNNFK